MKAGNVTYATPADIPSAVPVFPLSGALLLPGGQIPLNIFEPRYLAMVDDAFCGDRLIGMIQPRFGADAQADDRGEPLLCETGCLGRITALQESCDGRYVINLSGVCRFRLLRETESRNGYRRCQLAVFADDLAGCDCGDDVDREALLATFRKYLNANNMEADWDSVNRASNESLVTTLAMMSPYGPAEKQALLEAVTLKSRAETLVAITEIALARAKCGSGSTLQ